MIYRFEKVDDGIYRGSAPSPQDVQWLKDNYNINKIISLDGRSGDKIERACQLLNIKQLKLPLDGSKEALINLFKNNIKSLLKDNGPTYIHCYYGKDRTGLLAAIYKCKYMGMDPEAAIKEAKSLGFGVGVNPDFINLYEKLIRVCKPQDENSADTIVDHLHESKSDNRTSPLDEAKQQSFAPYLSKTRQYPYDDPYSDLLDQSQTRNNVNQSIKQHKNELSVPLIGNYNNGAGIVGVGPTLNPGGFIYE